jgi:hypothetical protein
MFMPISHPWLAPRSPRIAGTEGGTQTREERSPSWCAQQVAVALDDRWWRSDRGSRMLLKASELATPRSRGVLCRAWVRRQSATTVEREPGRERPPLPPPGPGPGPCGGGVVHAPAACLVCPDEVVRARAIDGTRCEYRNRQSDGHAQYVETVAAIVHIFLNRRMPCH